MYRDPSRLRTRWCCPVGMDTRGGVRIRSDICVLDELLVAYAVGVAVQRRLSLGDAWPSRWLSTWRINGDDVVWPVRDAGAVPVVSSEPVRNFTWRARQRHRPGLQFLVSTGRHHGFESLEEQQLLLALDFLRVAEALPQPFCLEFEHVSGRARHIPDFLAIWPDGGRWLFDVRPRGLIEEEDALKFAAAQEMATSCGWRYTVVTQWRPHVRSVLDQLSAQRRLLEDRLGLQSQLADAAGAAGMAIGFGQLVEGTTLPVVARAHALHLLWHRRLGVDLGRPLQDASPVWRGCDDPA
jgi:hypothetical protein